MITIDPKVRERIEQLLALELELVLPSAASATLAGVLAGPVLERIAAELLAPAAISITATTATITDERPAT
jgi:hypothetical protein